jgi:uncharacterized protein (TIGR00725 family)
VTVGAGAPYVAVIGSGSAGGTATEHALVVGRALGRHGAVLVCGGLGGVMEAACRGAREEGGMSVGLLPGADRRDANGYVSIAIATGLGEARNAIVAAAADVVIAVDGEYGTLSEIALALAAGTPVVGIGTWELAREGSPVEAIERVEDPEAAVERALALAVAR